MRIKAALEQQQTKEYELKYLEMESLYYKQDSSNNVNYLPIQGA
ncbi:MAG: hypothetical protein WA945_07725 [Arcobacteraceae bacterium]